MNIKLPFTNNRRSEIVRAALWLVDHREQCTYSEGPFRYSCVHKPFQVPFVSDCSTGVTDLYSWGQAPDPNGLGFSGDPYTGTLITHGREIRASRVRSADIGIFGPGTGWHAVLVTQGGSDPEVWSMGEQGDPKLYKASVVAQAVAYVNHTETCPVRWFRYDTSLARP